MTREEIERKIGDSPKWRQASDSQRDAFVTHMQECNYGREPLMDAWWWFLAGWDGGETATVECVNRTMPRA